MNRLWTIARKELHGFFHSPVALIFLAIFLGATVFTFFWQEKFFARGLADVRPMFEWMPTLLILLVSALTMRMWSEEQRSGTIEVLLTLPIPPHSLVLGKFLAGFLLVALALILTLPIPITVSMMGDLDWGPVTGGYLAALLLAGAYLSVGLCVSTTTDNPLVALFGTGLGCGFLYLLGADSLVEGQGAGVAEILRSLGTGSRFESVARGVLDVRDLAYYLGLSTFFVVLNIALLKAKRWSSGPRSGLQRRATYATVGLTLANIVALNLWLAPVNRARVDLTEDGLYSLSEVTRDLVSSVDQPLVIRGYFSESIHPRIDPLVPEIRDLLREYEIAGDGKVVVELVDPDGDEELEKEAFEEYGVTPQQFPIATRKKQALVSAYFDIVVQYGDQHEVLNFDQIINVVPLGVGELEIELGNLEYELTKAIKKTVYGFQDLDAVFAALGEPVVLTAYVSEDLAPNLQADLDTIEKVTGEFVGRSSGQMRFVKETPSTRQEQEELFRRYGLEPFAKLSGGGEGMALETFYFHFILTVGDRAVVIRPPEDLTESSMREVLESALEQAMPGFIKTIGLVTPPAPPSPNPQMARQMGRRQQPPPQSFRELRSALSEEHRVRSVSLSSGEVDEEIDVLILAGPENLGEQELEAVDQYLMRGGAVIAFVGKQRLNLTGMDLSTQPVDSGLEDLLRTYGVELRDHIVLDTRSDMFAVVDPARRRAEPIEAPYVLRLDKEGLASHLTTSNLPGLLVHHASPLRLVDPAGARGDSPYRAEVLGESSAEAWLVDNAPIGAGTTLERPEEVTEEQAGPHPIAVAITGSLASHFAPDESGDDAVEDDETDDAGAEESSDAQGKTGERLLQRSPPDTRLVVIGSSSMVADTPLGLSADLARVGGAPLAEHNLGFVLNLIDWAVEDTDLLRIRARSGEARLLEIEVGEEDRWEYINYLIALVLVLGVFAVTTLRRRARARLTLVPRSELGMAHGMRPEQGDDDKEDL